LEKINEREIMNPIIAMWAIPRSRGTAFERMMIERQDFQVLHEPFNSYFYKSSERISDRMPNEKPEPHYHYTHILQGILNQAKTSPVFIKDLAYYIANVADESFLTHFKNVFFIRHPKDALPSYFNAWSDFTLIEAGYAEIYKLYEIAYTMNDTPPLIIDSDDLLTHPQMMVEAFCDAVGIPFIASALQWGEMTNPQWDRWNNASVEWHAKLKKSTGFHKTDNKNYLVVHEHPHLSKAYEYCLPFYEKLYENALFPCHLPLPEECLLIGSAG
jgi:hypothetical protein